MRLARGLEGVVRVVLLDDKYRTDWQSTGVQRAHDGAACIPARRPRASDYKWWAVGAAVWRSQKGTGGGWLGAASEHAGAGGEGDRAH